jgi:hypothetical protein
MIDLTSPNKTAILRTEYRTLRLNRMTNSIATSTYRHNRKENTYLFVRQDFNWDDLPEALRQQFSVDAKVIDFDMTPTRKLARAASAQVWAALTEQGYYLQMPPADPLALKAMEDGWVAQQEASKIV